jgi:hypothetical protein
LPLLATGHYDVTFAEWDVTLRVPMSTALNAASSLRACSFLPTVKDARLFCTAAKPDTTTNQLISSGAQTASVNLSFLFDLEAPSKQSSATEHAIARFKTFATYGDDWDDRGARAPNQEAIDGAMQFLSNLQPWHPAPFATIDREGNAIIELNDASTNYFSSIVFNSATHVELYAHRGDRPSAFFEGDVRSNDARHFLSVEMQISLP